MNGIYLYFVKQTLSSWPLLGLLTLHQILDLSKLKAFADNQINVREQLKFVLGSMENRVGKGENAGYHNVFKRLFSQGR